MNLVVDTNRVIAALLKDSSSRKTIKNVDYAFITPDFSLEEINKYKTVLIYTIVEGLEKIGDMLRDFCKFILQKKKYRISQNLKEIYKSVRDNFDIFYVLFYNFKLEKIEDIETNRVKFKESIRNYLKKTGGYQEIEGLIILNAAYELIYDLTGPLIAFRS